MDKRTYILYRDLLHVLEMLHVGAVVCRVVEGNLYTSVFDDEWYDECPCCNGSEDEIYDAEDQQWLDTGMDKY